MGSIISRYSGNEPARSAPTPPPLTPLSFPEVLSPEDQRLEKMAEIELNQSVGRSKSDQWQGRGGGGAREGDSLAAQHSKSCNFETEHQK